MIAPVYTQRRVGPALEAALGKAMREMCRKEGHRRGLPCAKSPNPATETKRNRRLIVRDMMEAGATPVEIASATGVSLETTKCDILSVRRSK